MQNQTIPAEAFIGKLGPIGNPFGLPIVRNPARLAPIPEVDPVTEVIICRTARPRASGPEITTAPRLTEGS